MKRIVLFIAVICSLAVGVKAQTTLFRLDARGLVNAMAISDHIVISRDVVIDSAITIPYGKTISFMNGAVIQADSTLIIQGQVRAWQERIFADNSDVKFAQYAKTVIYPEWFGAKPMEDCRDTSVNAASIDNSDAFEAAVNCIQSIHYPTNNEFTGHQIVLSGIYGVTRKITVKNRTVKFVGTSPYFNGTGFRFIGTLTGDSAQAYILEFDGANASGLENVCFKGKRTTNDAIRQSGAVNMICSPGGTPQRHLMFHHVWIGDRIGNWGDVTSGLEFETGFSCGTTGSELNNDFFGFYDIGIGNTRIGILNNLNMAVDWTIDKYSFGYGETMLSMPNGGTMIGREWYPALSTDGGFLIKCGDNAGTTTRIEITNWDSEHLPSDGLLWGNGTIRAYFSNGHLTSDGVGAAGTGFQILGGDANIYDPIIEFDRISFLSEGAKPMYFDCSDASGSRGYFKFTGCTSVEGIAFKMPLASSRATMYIDVEGRKLPNDADKQMFLQASLNNSHPDINGTTGLIYMSSLLTNGVMDIPYQTIMTGKRGIQLMKGQYNDMRSAFSAANDSMVYNYMLPANVNITGVTVAFYESNVIASGDYVKVGIPGDPEKFGRITGTAAGVYNNKNNTGGVIFTSATQLILTAFNSSDAPVNMTGGRLQLLSVDYEKHGEGILEMSINAISDLPYDGAE